MSVSISYTTAVLIIEFFKKLSIKHSWLGSTVLSHFQQLFADALPLQVFRSSSHLTALYECLVKVLYIYLGFSYTHNNIHVFNNVTAVL